MTFVELIKQTKFNDVKKALLNLYPDQSKNVFKYERIYNSLKTKNPKPMDIHWMIIVELSGNILNEKEKHWQVYGVMYDDPFKERYDMKYIPWSEWLSYEISPIKLKQAGILEFVALCLYEMTFYGFDEKTIQDKNPNNKEEPEEEDEFTEDMAENVTDVLVDRIDKTYFFYDILEEE